MTVFTNRIDPNLEEDVQWIFIKKMRAKDGSLIVTSEHGTVYQIDLKTRLVTPAQRQTLMDASQYTIQNESPFGFAPLVWECLPFITLALAIFATVRCVRRGQQGVALILWLLFIWLVPIIGSLVAISAIRRPALPS